MRASTGASCCPELRARERLHTKCCCALGPSQLFKFRGDACPASERVADRALLSRKTVSFPQAPTCGRNYAAPRRHCRACRLFTRCVRRRRDSRPALRFSGNGAVTLDSTLD